MGDTLSFLPSLGPAGRAFVFEATIYKRALSWKPSGFFRIIAEFFLKKSLKKHKIHAWAIDESSGKIYIHFHRRNTELRQRTNKKFFDRSGKEITD